MYLAISHSTQPWYGIVRVRSSTVRFWFGDKFREKGAVEDFIFIDFLQLQTIDLWQLCKNNSSIKILRLAYCSQITNNGVRSALHMLNMIEHLDLEGIKDSGCEFFAEPYTQLPNMSSSVNLKNLKKFHNI